MNKRENGVGILDIRMLEEGTGFFWRKISENLEQLVSCEVDFREKAHWLGA